MELTEADRGIIRRNAYFKWLDAGAPPGDGVEFWLDAEFDYLHDAGEDEPGGDAAEWVSEANPARQKRSQPDKEILIGTRG